ncbi:unnamed protein product [Urochloa humidicola]
MLRPCIAHLDLAPPLVPLPPSDIAATDCMTSPLMSGLMRLHCVIKHYELGRYGATSFVARLTTGDDAGEDCLCAQLWMGTHRSAPSALAPNVSIHVWIARNPVMLSRVVHIIPRGKMVFSLGIYTTIGWKN